MKVILWIAIHIANVLMNDGSELRTIRFSLFHFTCSMGSIQSESRANEGMDLDNDNYAKHQDQHFRIECTVTAPPSSPQESATLDSQFASTQKARHALVVERLLHRCNTDVSCKVKKRQYKSLKPSRIPIRSSRLRAQALLSKATNDLAGAISTIRLSPTRPQNDPNL